MRAFAAISLTALALAHAVSAQSTSNFAGQWKLNRVLSEIRGTGPSPDELLTVEQGTTSIAVKGAQGQQPGYPLNGKEITRENAGSKFRTTTKWEGSALLANTVVSGPENYSISEVWRRSRDGNTLTIRRTIIRRSGETESTLVYEPWQLPINDETRPVEITRAEPRTSSLPDPSASSPSSQPHLRVFGHRDPPAPSEAAPAKSAPPNPEYVVASGTHILLRLTSSVNTKHTAPGDRVYLETATPIYVNERLVIPVGSYVAGTVTESERAGKVKGKAELNVRFDTLSLQNGVTRDLRSRLGSAGSAGKVDSEGNIKGEGDKANDAKTVGKTTGAGAGIGTLAGAAAGHPGLGAGIGAAAGAAAGLGRVLTTRGPDVILQKGTTMEMILDRDIAFTGDELR